LKKKKKEQKRSKKMTTIESIVAKPFKGYAKCTTDNGAIMIGTDLEGQALRIFIRGVADQMGMPDAKNSRYVPLLSCTIMLKMFLTCVDIDSIYMKLLQQIAIKQLSMNFVIGKDSYGKPLYESIGFYENFKNGILPPLHFSKPDNHLSLFTDPHINPFRMEQAIWWASMMAMIGLFDEQLPHYEGALRVINIVEAGTPITRSSFLKFIFDEYSAQVSGNYVLAHVKIRQPRFSIFTMEVIPDDIDIFELQPHGDGCSTMTCASMEEIQNWFLTNGCPFCRHGLDLSNFKQITQTDHIQELEKFNATPSTFKMKASASADSASASSTSSRGLFIMLQGTVGSGKTCARNELVSQLQEKYPALNVEVFCPDDYSKTGAKNGVQIVKTNLQQFIQSPQFKIGIIDTCGDMYREADPNKICFDTSLVDYDIKIFRPNFNVDDPEGYLSFSLENVLNRGMHSSSTDFWLNHHSAGIQTCVSVHSKKTKNLFKKKHNFRVNEKGSLTEILGQIEPNAHRYRSGLLSMNVQVQDFIATNIQL